MTTDLLSALSDEELMKRLGQGEMEPLGELYMRHGAMVRAAIGCLVTDLPGTEAEDLLQEVFLTLGETAARCNRPDKFRSWLYGIAVRKARNRRRTLWLRNRLLRLHWREGPGAAIRSDDSPERSAETREAVLEILSRVHRSQREVLVLHLLEGLGKDEVADVLGISTVTVRTRLHRARQVLLGNKGASSDPEVEKQ